ncbi:MAG: hypothetical protein HEEMFOPI_00827 [Holosporales bacterium]
MQTFFFSHGYGITPKKEQKQQQRYVDNGVPAALKLEEDLDEQEFPSTRDSKQDIESPNDSGFLRVGSMGAGYHSSAAREHHTIEPSVQ